jgi:hypothetical protein
LREINADTLYVTVDVLNRIRVTAGIVVEINGMPASKKMARFGGTKIIILCIVLPNLHVGGGGKLGQGLKKGNRQTNRKRI